MSKLAKILQENISEIMELWQNQVIQDVPAAKNTNAIALFDHLPNIILDIASIMERCHSVTDLNVDKSYLAILDNSVQHGKHRASIVNYNVEQVVHEYIIFHRVLSKYIATHDGYKKKKTELLKYIIETAILKCIGSFSLALQQMQEKIIGTIAHDIRNPLSAAQLALEVVQEDLNGKWTNKMLGAAQRSVRKALHLIEELMNGIKIKAGEGMMFNFENINLIEELKLVQTESKEFYTNEINLEYDTKKIEGVFDATAIKRLLENLISNAVKYGFAKQPITISVKNEEDAVEIKVHNHGTPIPADKQDQIFDFMGSVQKEEEVVSGSWGMGLTLTQIVAEAHGGDINLVSDEKTGTTFIVNLIKQFNEPGKRRMKINFAA
ncbi:sensor histidine kinase [Rasiella sp. SM2506]|uniref:sensor histidine kinase n=1 Tax=Rasiella sp. SM2506 TaxID=3423914 RepID=UPI003D7B0837